MKNVSRLLVLAALATAFALPAFAQDTTPAGGGAAAQCTAEADAKAALYKKFLDNYKGTPDQQKIASDTAHDYLTKYGSCPDPADQQIATFIQKWVTKYDAAVADFNCNEALRTKNYQQAFDLCQQILNKQPDNTAILLGLANAGYSNAVEKTPNKSLFPQSVNYARTALQDIDSGKITDFTAYKGKENAIGFFNYTLALLLRESSPQEAVDALLKAVQSNTVYKTEPTAYYLLGTLYYNNEVKTLAADYQAKYPAGTAETPESKTAYDKINAAIDRSIDAFARAVALSKDATQKKSFMDQLTAVYKSRHEGHGRGLDALLANVLNTPLMLPGHEPPPTPSATSGTDSNAAKPAATTQPATKPATPATKPPVSKATPTTGRTTSGH